jgi:ADP-ribose pyrophosphatase
VHSSAHLFLARKLTFSESHQEGTEIIRLVKIPFKEAVKMVMDSKITHAQTAVLILKVKEFLKNHGRIHLIS